MLLITILPSIIFGTISLGLGLLLDRFLLRARVKSRLRARLLGLALGALLLMLAWMALLELFFERMRQGSSIEAATLVFTISFLVACLLNAFSLWRLWRAPVQPNERDIFG